MRYLLTEKIFALGDDFTIRDENNRKMFQVDGKVLSFGDNLTFKNMKGEELARIEQKLLSMGPTYNIVRDGKQIAEVKKRLFTLFRAKFYIDVPGPDDLEAQGSFIDHEYVFRRGSHVVATVSKKWFTMRDTYAIDIAEGEDPVIILASAVVIDLVMHEE